MLWAAFTPSNSRSNVSSWENQALDLCCQVNVYWVSVVIFSSNKRQKKKKEIQGLLMSHIWRFSKKIYIISYVNTEINNGTYWMSNLKVKWCSEESYSETTLNKLLPLTYISEYYIQRELLKQKSTISFLTIQKYNPILHCECVLVLVSWIKKNW